jgi:hypothetical protein
VNSFLSPIKINGCILNMIKKGIRDTHVKQLAHYEMRFVNRYFVWNGEGPRRAVPFTQCDLDEVLGHLSFGPNTPKAIERTRAIELVNSWNRLAYESGLTRLYWIEE